MTLQLSLDLIIALWVFMVLIDLDRLNARLDRLERRLGSEGLPADERI